MFFEDIIFEDSNDLFSIEDGLNHGNMFKDEYIGYKNYKVAKLVSTNNKGELLLKIYQLDFALNDLSLYLDLHPDNRRIYELFREYSTKEKMLVQEYEEMYGPMELDDSNYDNYLWYMGPWPWTKEGSNV